MITLRAFLKERLVPVALFLLLTVVYLMSSGAPLRVHALTLICLLLSFLVPALLVSDFDQLRNKRRLVGALAVVLSGMLLWDGAAHRVILKAEPFDILLHTPWIYALGLLCFGTLTLVSAATTTWLAAHHRRRTT